MNFHSNQNQPIEILKCFLRHLILTMVYLNTNYIVYNRYKSIYFIYFFLYTNYTILGLYRHNIIITMPTDENLSTSFNSIHIYIEIYVGISKSILNLKLYRCDIYIYLYITNTTYIYIEYWILCSFQVL